MRIIIQTETHRPTVRACERIGCLLDKGRYLATDSIRSHRFRRDLYRVRQRQTDRVAIVSQPLSVRRRGWKWHKEDKQPIPVNTDSEAPGGAAAIFQNGRIAHEAGYGPADSEQHAPMTLRHTFQPATSAERQDKGSGQGSCGRVC